MSTALREFIENKHLYKTSNVILFHQSFTDRPLIPHPITQSGINISEHSSNTILIDIRDGNQYVARIEITSPEISNNGVIIKYPSSSKNPANKKTLTRYVAYKGTQVLYFSLSDKGRYLLQYSDKVTIKSIGVKKT
jgi:hypothetical protein